MPEIRFIVGYRGVLTEEMHYKPGDVADLPAAHALVADGRAEWLDDPRANPIQLEPVKAADLDGLDDQSLRDMAKAAGIKSYWNKRRERIIAELGND